MNHLTNLVQFPGLGLSFQLNRVAFTIGGVSIYWYGVCIAVGLCLALVFAFRHSIEFGVDPDGMVDVILIGVVLGIISARAYYVAMAPFKYESIWEMIAIRDGGLAIYGGIIGGFLFGGLACKWRGVPVLPMFDLTAMGFLLGQGCGRWGNFFNQEAFGCNTTLPWGMYSETTRAYLMSSTVTVPKGVVIDPNLPVHPTFLYESIWCFVGFFLLFRYIKKRKFNGDITLRYLIWYGAGRFWIEGLRTDSLMLVPSIGLRASQLVAGIAVVAGIAAEVYFTRKCKGKSLLVPLALGSAVREVGRGGWWQLAATIAGIFWLTNRAPRRRLIPVEITGGGSTVSIQALYDTGSPNATLPGATINDVANEDLTWESNHNLNVGLEARLLDRIDLSFEFYNRKTTDMLLSYPLASSSGFDSYYRNSGEMRNRGIEFAVTGWIFDRRDFQWSVTWMGSTVSNKVLKLTEDGKDIIGSTQIIREGETLYSYYVARSAGVDPMTGEKMYWATDKDGNDYITKSTTVAQANRVIAGSRIPDLYGSLSTSLRWKNLDFSISTNYSIGGKNYDGVYYEFMSCYYTAQAKHKDMLRAWRKPGDVTDVPKYTIGETPIVTDDKLVDASYFSIKNITLGYTLPRRWTSKIGFKAARVSASVDNLCIFTHLKGMDPQYSLTGGTSYAYAPTRTVSFNLDLKF